MKLGTMFFLLYATTLVFFGFQKAAQSGPAVRLTANPPWPDVFRGETITLSCQVIESEGWTFVWTRHRQGGLRQLSASISNSSELVLSVVSERQSGMYQCEAVKGNERAFSNIHTITVSADRPQAVIVTDPPATVMFTGETVSLACDIRNGPGWRYSWSRNTQGRLESLYARSTESQQKHILHSVRESDNGEYLCQGERGQNPVIQSSPGSFLLHVSGEKPRPVITQNPPSGEMYTGERVTLSCGFCGEPAGWEYLWYKDTLRHTVPNTDSSRTDGSSFTISSAALAHSGEYRCRAARGRKPFYSDYSDPLTLEISVLPQTYLFVQSGLTDVFPTETVTLRCVSQGSSTDWMYKWYRDGRELPVDKANSSSVNGDTYTILSADQSHAGLYTCRGELTRRASVHSLIGSSAALTIRALPQAVVSLDEGWMGVFITKGTLAMRCELQGFTSADWNYTWYRDGTQISLNHTGERHTVGFWDSSSDGEYRCSGNRTDRPYYSLISEGFMPSHIIYRAVENVVRICVGVAVLLFLSIIVNPAFWRWVSRRKVVHSGEELADQTDHT
ncbi:leukocyte immunoglobulin-like receptor subfamily A member 4 [Anguilla anguilla]|uniref:leukocyte immunoglobulin-like receptor subfamily A member 4 n=1 Tax=Anguilla anguilla TaxID=7936 RepID=UPI0015B30D39|nr:leukocyte immunoglobulin-like receptor subfamily A member 4 [Anguilla anguilla]